MLTKFLRKSKQINVRYVDDKYNKVKKEKILMKKLFFCNVAWLKENDGKEPDIISGGGSYIEKHYNGEIFNFRNINEGHYGFVATQGYQIRIERLKERSINSVDNILVVWLAPKPDEDNKIIGWYNNAEVYRDVQIHKNIL